MISTEEKEKRMKALEFAINNNAIEGLTISNDTKDVLLLWVNGKITIQEVEEKMYALL